MPPGVSPAGLPSLDAAGRSPPAIDWNDEKSSPAQNEAPSPDSTTARTPVSVFNRSPASRNPANIAPSRALRLSGRLSRTSATPLASMEMVTRSLIGAASIQRHCSPQ